jgi:inner membrane protein
MATLLTHALVGASLATLAPPGPYRGRFALALAAAAMAPDLDVVAFRFGLPYGHPLGHRGLSHSLLFAAGLAAAAMPLLSPLAQGHPQRRAALSALLFAATASHGVLDAMTDAGRGIGFFLPFTTERYFLPFRPLRTSPIGLARFLAGDVAGILASEARWVWLPCAVLVGAVGALRRRAHRPPWPRRGGCDDG